MLSFEALQIFHGEANPARARVYCRLARPPEGGHWRLAGRIVGPRSALGRTLPAAAVLRDLGPGPTLLAEAVLPDPCFWSPALPALYDVEVNLVDERGERRASEVRELGLRLLGGRGSSFYLEGKRWVLRAVDAGDEDASLEAYREAWAARIVNSPEEDLCRAASQQGVMLVAWLQGSRDEVESELRRLARWASVAMAILDCDEPLDETIRAAAPNLLLAQARPPRRADEPPPWAHAVFAEVEAPPDFTARYIHFRLPVVAFRRISSSLGLPCARAACDDLQRDLAPHGDFAGYCVIREERA